MSGDERLQLRRTQAAMRAMALACSRRGEHAKARKIRRVQVALNRAWRPGCDLDAWLRAAKMLIVDAR